MGYFSDLHAEGPYRTCGEADEARRFYPDEYRMATQAHRTTLTAAKVITPIVHRDNGRVEIEYLAEYDGQPLGFFPTRQAAEIALNDLALDHIEQGLVTSLVNWNS